MSDPKVPQKSDEKTEEEWEEEIVVEALGDALNPDGSIDFDKLDARTIPITLDEFYPEGDQEDESKDAT